MSVTVWCGGPDCYPELVKGLKVDNRSTECCLTGPLVQDKSYEKCGIKMMICPKCHMHWRTMVGLPGLRCIWYAPPQMIVEVLGEGALTAKEKEEYDDIKGTWLETLRLMPM